MAKKSSGLAQIGNKAGERKNNYFPKYIKRITTMREILAHSF